MAMPSFVSLESLVSMNLVTLKAAIFYHTPPQFFAKDIILGRSVVHKKSSIMRFKNVLSRFTPCAESHLS